MRWDDERFVKVYTRDTPDWLALGWEAHALFWELLRKSDRAGLFEVGKSGARGVAAVTGIPTEVVERALPVLIADGCIESHGAYLLVRNFIEAQSANQSDKARAAKSRQAARDSARRNAVITSQNVTGNEEESRYEVTKRDSNAENVTPRLEDTRLARIEEPEESNSLARDPGTTTTEHVAREPQAFDWLEAFKVAHQRAHNGTFYGRGEQDAKAQGKLADLLDEMPATEREMAWTKRDAIFAEYLTDGSVRLSQVGHSFAFFVEAFSALRIPRENRPKSGQQPERADGSRSGPKPFRWPELKVPAPRKVASP